MQSEPPKESRTMSLMTRSNPDTAASEASRMTVTLYTRPQCCCCQSAREVLLEYQDVYGYHFEEMDASDPALIDRIGPTVPVIAVDGKVRFRGEVNRVLFERLLASRQAG
ncbi:glutaredoxin family protein [Tundrisphaera lichenicola]|uniref:glutaredoxin family protein n=1 Tax=Tundrisphaera lichenicola TaxID=2029860 RepID=UPI003EB82205